MAEFWAFMTSSNAVSILIVLVIFILALCGKITGDQIANVFGGIFSIFVSKKS